MATELDASGRMRNHWWWRPGWRVGRRMYTWHATFDNQAALHQLVEAYQAALKPLAGLDLIPREWLHLTMQGIRFTDEIDADDVAKVVDGARKRLENRGPVTFKAERPIVDPEAIMFRVEPPEELRHVRNDIRNAIAEVWGTEQVPESPDWSPHISIAYSNAEGPAAPFIDALSTVEHSPVTVTLPAVQLIVLDRDTRLYRWRTEASAQLRQIAG